MQCNGICYYIEHDINTLFQSINRTTTFVDLNSNITLKLETKCPIFIYIVIFLKFHTDNVVIFSIDSFY